MTDELTTPEVKRPQGRPSKFTPDIKAEILNLVQSGTPIKTSCAIVGIGQSTYQTWKGIALKEDEDGEFAQFFNNISRARAIAEKTLLDRAQLGDGREYSRGPAVNAQWVLERSFKDYAPRLNMKVDEMTDLTIDAVAKVCADKDCGCYEAILSALQALEEARESSNG